jgi:excisionase family DNA binding protein
MEESALITVKEAAALLSCSTRNVHNLIKYGEISGYGENVGKKGIRVLASELRDYAKSSMFNAKNRKQQGTTTQKTMTE